MVSGRKRLIAGLAVCALTISTSGEFTVRAQEPKGSSLSERLSSLGHAFTRKKSPSKPSAQRPTTSRPNNHAASRPHPSASGNKSAQSTSRSTLSNLLPSGLFSRKKASAKEGQPPGTDYNPPDPPPFIAKAQEKPAANLEQSTEKKPEAKVQAEVEVTPLATVASSAASKILEAQVNTKARKSPSTARQEDLNATLSDLLENEAILTDTTPAESEHVVTDRTPPVAIPPVVEKALAATAAPAEQIAAEVKKPAKTEKQEQKKTEALAEVPAKAEAGKKGKDSFDVLAAIESVAADAETAGPAETETAQSPAAKQAPARTVAAKAKPASNAPVDVHETLLSGELYDELLEAQTEAETDGEQVAENASVEQEKITSLDEAIAAAPKPAPARSLPDPRAEERVAAVTALPFETMGETPEAPEPGRKVTQPALVAQRELQPVEPAQRDRIRTEAMPITSLRKPTGDVLVSSEQPVIVSHVEGPRSILVGREASYRVILENTSNIAAQNLSAAIEVPEWADLVDVVSTSGEVARHGADTGSSTMEWRLPELAARSSQTLRLRLIPRSGREFELGVQWSQESSSAQAHVEVQEPKLEMSIQGPQEVLFGSPQRFRLTIFNPGTGPAERVAVCLIPPGKNSADAATHVIGNLGPDEVKEIEMELTAREAGELIIQASATATGGLEAEAIKRVLCHKPELEVDWRGPDEKFAGTETAYYFRVRNPGSAATDPVEVRLHLPQGIRFLSASDSYAVDSSTGVVTWRMSGLAPGEEQFMQVRCQLDSPGAKEFDITARTVNGELRDSKSIHTNVVALADLKLNISDPQGARPVGETVVYEIRVENRGTTDAHGVSVIGLFSDGIDPVSVEGGQNSVRDGRVTFQPVKSLPAGGEVLLRIRAVASQVGTHVFRAEVNCQDLDLKLAAEETTRFFQDEFHWEEGETPYTAERTSGTISR